jgi:hypothetical protein
MKTQEAIKEIKSYADNSWGSLNEAFEMAIKALEKQISKKPTYEETGNAYGALKRTCANCDDVCFIGEDAKPFEHYCRYCGQKFDDWSDTDEQNDR